MRQVSVPLLLLLAACATPLEQCIASASRGLRVLDGLVASTRANIDRGYAIVTENFFITEEQVCGQIDEKPVYCDVPVAESREVPVAIDLNAERAKLDSLLTKRAELAMRAEAAIGNCRTLYPEV